MSRNMKSISLGMRRHADDAVATGRPFLLVLFGVFVVIMLVALLVGLQGYRAIADERNAIDEQRLAYGSLVNTVKAFDSIDALSVSEYDGNDVLSMMQRTATNTYIMLLYVHDGMLMQQYSIAYDVDVSPADAHALFATSTFKVDYTDGLLTLVTDDAQPCIYLTTPQPFLAHKVAQRAPVDSEAGDA